MLSQDEYGGTKLYWAASNNRIEEAEKMIDEANDLDIVSELVNKGDNNGFTPLLAASRYEHHQMAKMLLNNGAEIDKATNHGWTPLMHASFNGHLEVVKLLIAHKADVHLKDNSGETALDMARQQGHTKVIEALQKEK